MLGSVRPNVLAMMAMIFVVSVVAIYLLGFGNTDFVVAVAAAFIAGSFAVAKDLVRPAKSDVEHILEFLAPVDIGSAVESAWRPNVICMVIMAMLVAAIAMFMLAGNPALVVAVATAFCAGGFAVIKDLVAPTKSDVQTILEHLAPSDTSEDT